MLMTTVTISGMTLPIIDRELHCLMGTENGSKRAQQSIILQTTYPVMLSLAWTASASR